MLLLLLAASAAAYAVLLLGYGQAAGLPALNPASWWPIGALARAWATLYENYANPPGVRA